MIFENMFFFEFWQHFFDIIKTFFAIFRFAKITGK